MSYWRCFYHLVWATHQRTPVLSDDLHQRFARLANDACQELGVLVLAVGGIEDHVHMVVSVPPRHAVSTVVQKIKGTTSRSFGADPDWTGWQGEYGVLTIGDRSVADAIAYVANQRAHHDTGTLRSHFETIDRREAPP